MSKRKSMNEKAVIRREAAAKRAETRAAISDEDQLKKLEEKGFPNCKEAIRLRKSVNETVKYDQP